MASMYTAKVAVAAAPYLIDRPYSYLVPELLRETVLPGVRVTVPFGRGNSFSEGFVLDVGEEESEKALKSVMDVLDEAPVLSREGIRLALFMQERYFCTFYEALKAMLPGGLWYRFREKVTLVSDAAEGRTKTECAAIAALREKGGTMEESALRELLGEAAGETLRAMRRNGLINVEHIPLRRMQDKSCKVLSLAINTGEALALAEKKKRSAPMRYAVITLLAELGEAAESEVRYYTGASAATLKSLVRDGIVVAEESESFRVPQVEKDPHAAAIALNDEQKAAYDGLCGLMNDTAPAVALLEGVTGSGKTLVYLKLAEEALRQGRTAMVLVPEIALTPQLMARFAAYFGDSVCMLHSALSLSERYDQWKRIRRGEVRLVLGTRSAVFAPLPSLALIVMDEEQEDSYISENAPRYHTRDIAKYRVAKSGGLLLLGSATPTVESAYYAREGVYHHFTLRRRFNEKELPRVLTVDLREELSNGNGGTVSETLAAEIGENLRRGEQSILFLNRRGNSRMLLCGVCGAAPYCPRCSVPLTYHSANGRLMCHYCGYSEPADMKCPSCGGLRKYVGMGTQKVEEELQKRFPGVAILRMDHDTVSARNTHEKLLCRFSEEKIPLLLGTQMVAKGLDFPNVTLVGVLQADLSLYVASYRAAERTFSLLTQVVGRSGRGEKPGRALIQSFTPKNDIIMDACRQDYEAFYSIEIRMRRIHRQPPFADQLTLTVSGTEEGQVRFAADKLRRALQQTLSRGDFKKENYEVVGPAPAPIIKLNNRFRYRVFIVGKNDRALRQVLRYYLLEFNRDKKNRGMILSVDVNASD